MPILCSQETLSFVMLLFIYSFEGSSEIISFGETAFPFFSKLFYKRNWYLLNILLPALFTFFRDKAVKFLASFGTS